jgi:hypothetical protein
LNQSRKPVKFDMPARYRIRIEGPLDPRWSDYLSGMAVSPAKRRGGLMVTTLLGKLTDMAALMGVLNTVYDLGYTLLEVQRLPGSEESDSDIPQTGGIQ